MGCVKCDALPLLRSFVSDSSSLALCSFAVRYGEKKVAHLRVERRCKVSRCGVFESGYSGFQ